MWLASMNACKRFYSSFIHQGGKSKPGRKKSKMELPLGISETKKAKEGKESLVKAILQRMVKWSLKKKLKKI